MTITTHGATLADAFEAMAQVEIQKQIRDDALVALQPITVAVERLTPHMSADDRDLWWGELKRCLIARDAARDGNGPWHDGGPDGGVDWDDRVSEALERLTGGDL